jgi:hypothetical protein
MGSRFRDRRFVTFAAAWALVAVTGSAQSQQFQVNSRSNGAQLSPAVAFEPGGGFVVVYEDVTTADPADHSIWRRRFDATGAPLGDDQYLGCPRACVWPVLAICRNATFTPSDSMPAALCRGPESR